ncbi:MAG: hypothetical protein Q4D23_12145 [Bacteroidales bacterium]|nr:hypothetical protein [Bacteroidales bacterium]
MSDNTFSSFEDQLLAGARDIVNADLTAAPAADPAAAKAIVAASSVAVMPPAKTHRVALWPTIGAAAACLAIGYVLPHPQQGGAEPEAPTARVERVEVVRTDTIYRERIVPQTVERIVERPVVQTVEVVRVDTISVPAAAPQPKHAPRSLANDGFVYAFNTIDE